MTNAIVELASRATSFSIHNRDQIKDDTQCGCYFCLRVCSGAEIAEWVDIGNDTAICPYCGIDALMPNKTNALLLEAAHVEFFTGEVPSSEIK